MESKTFRSRRGDIKATGVRCIELWIKKMVRMAYGVKKGWTVLSGTGSIVTQTEEITSSETGDKIKLRRVRGLPNITVINVILGKQ